MLTRIIKFLLSAIASIPPVIGLLSFAVMVALDLKPFESLAHFIVWAPLFVLTMWLTVWPASSYWDFWLWKKYTKAPKMCVVHSMSTKDVCLKCGWKPDPVEPPAPLPPFNKTSPFA
jgi:hypothetical protein